ncbi:MAG: leucyl aminopeptidase [Planctomycetota bacterium]|jgi:leucyl aminopeptidase
MKKIINVEVKTRKVDPDLSKCKTDLLVIGLFSDKASDKFCKQLDKQLDGAIEKLGKLGDFKGKEGTISIVYGDSRIAASRVMLVGLGESKGAGLDTVRKAACLVAKKAVEIKAKNVSLAMHLALGKRYDATELAQVCSEGIHYGSYRYDEFVTDNENGRLETLKVDLVDPDPAKIIKLGKGVSIGAIIGQAQSYVRTIANRPANVICPETLAVEARKVAKLAKNLTCTVFDEKQLKAKGMGGILAVGSGSENKPRLIVMKYTPASRKAKKLPTIALVGKAVTFDSGGISIKPAQGMQEMKLDKSGGIAVLGTIKAISQLNLPVNVYGIIPSAENLPSGSSYRPGDIIKTFSGKTVEVQNTDAEGRMILCDALNYAVQRDCDIIIDIATLTGACKVALGQYMAALMSNDEKLVKQLQKASQRSGEKIWHMPSGVEYAKEMKSKIADLKNIGSRWGGACTAAAFLSQFIGDKKWAHIDMASVDLCEKPTEFAAEGSSGFGVRLFTSYLMNLCSKTT